jgi:hypothetical protein
MDEVCLLGCCTAWSHRNWKTFRTYLLPPSSGRLYGSVKLLGAGVAQSVQCLATDWTTGRSRFDLRNRQKIFPLASVSRPALGPTQPPVQWVPRVLSPGIKHSVTLTTQPIYCRGREWVGAIPHLPLRLHICVVGLLYLYHQPPLKRRTFSTTLNGAISQKASSYLPACETKFSLTKGRLLKYR